MTKVEILKDGVVAAGSPRNAGDIVEVSTGELSALEGVDHARRTPEKPAAKGGKSAEKPAG